MGSRLASHPMSRPVVGIVASTEPVSWGPWLDRPSALAPAALTEAVQRAGWMPVLLVPDADRELLGALDALVAFEGVVEPEGLLSAAAELGLATAMLMTPANGSLDDFAGELAGLLPS